MRKNNKSKVQLLEFAEALKSIAADVSANDKKNFISKNGCSEATISRYLKGDVKDTSIAYKLLVFFKKEIQKRNSILA